MTPWISKGNGGPGKIFCALIRDYLKYLVSIDPDSWRTDISAVYLGRCHTLQFPEAVGSLLDDYLLTISFNQSLSYDIFMHDPKYFFTTLNPAAFPHIRIKRKPLQNETDRNYDFLYVSQTKHSKLNRDDYPCEEDDQYNFRQCVKNSVIQKIGCRMTWDQGDAKLCSTLQEMRDYEREFLLLSQVEEREVLQATNCLPPCQYSEFKLVQNNKGFYAYYGMNLAYATTEIVTETEDWVYPGLSFIAEFGGALGLFVGVSFYTFWDIMEWIIKKYCSKEVSSEDKDKSDEMNMDNN